MTFSHAMFQLLIYPLQLIYELIFYYAKLFTGSAGVAIIALSLAVNFMLLPLYNRADAIQNEEREQEKKMDRWIKHIKKTFSGNERFMMLQTYYRQNNYKPYYTLRGILPLMLEIPFFIAAYHYLSGLSDLNVGFGPISDMSVPDALLQIGGTSINILPIIMTLINIISAAIYTKGLKFKDKLQLYGMAALFLVLLYDSPSGLVLYWTLNNIFSLVKNIICKLRNKSIAVGITISLIGSSAIAWSLYTAKDNSGFFTPLLIIGIILQLPLIVIILRNKVKLPEFRIISKEHEPSFPLYIGGCLSLTALTGVLIPSSVIISSPMEFVQAGAIVDPMIHVLNSLLLASGMFLIWFGLFYYLSSRTVRWASGIIVSIASILAVINYMFFGTNLGIITSQLKFNRPVSFTTPDVIKNLAVLTAAAAIILLIRKKSTHFVQKACIVIFTGIIGMSGINAIGLLASVPSIRQSLNYSEENGFEELPNKLIHLSKNKDNVIVLMMDRAAGSYLPYLFKERPELKKQFDGFTYYPNTLSYGQYTNLGSPALYGGYEYTPSEMNNRTDKSLQNKHNEALKVMPDLFSKNGFDVTLIEPTYAGYSWIPDLSVFDEYPEIRKYNVEQGQLVGNVLSEKVVSLNDIWNRNFFCYSLMKISPCFMQPWLYQGGAYHSSTTMVQYASGFSDMHFVDSINGEFLNSYAVLHNLPDLTECENTQNSTFLMMSNSSTHEPQLLKEPEYIPALYSDNSVYDSMHEDRFTVDGRTMAVKDSQQMMHYHINMASMIMLGAWFDCMREQGVYDNTRIIIVADHGPYNLCQFDDLILDRDAKEDALSFNPLLLVKDFNSSGFKTDDSFMTNADTPTLAFDKLINDPVNPFTGNPVTNSAKQGEQYVIASDAWNIGENNGNAYMPGQWYSVHDNIFDIKNWTKRDWH